ncbi:hypothetical protein PHLGIDRAFT_146014 [Phlebiopsis gigantea 11061_1 CR5-6]|uniref:C2H2-type domain-containing protein n=1 Tax=Phlebiopsis gigantea (strain 11061_1 CR5-6) TaxID=745531 RepID=A0A0C3PI08_PHLG1|nr:hypothetical protein PHLGIDRAFT_146014 [Phlebiopsis gigantea 11061_1 CR5-6]
MLQANGTIFKCSSRYRCKTHAAHKCARGVETTLPFNPFELPDSPRKEYTSEEVDEYQRVLDSLCCEASVPRGPPLRGEQDQTPRVICAFCHKPCVKRLRDMGRHLNTHRIGFRYVCSYDDCEHGEHQKSNLENHIRMDHTFDLLACTVILRRKTDDTPPFVCGFLSPDNRRISMHRNKCHSEWKVNKTVCSADLKQPHIFEEDDIIYDEDTLRSVYSDLETDLLTECSKKKKAVSRAPHAPATRKSVPTAPIDNSTNKRRPARTSASLSGCEPPSPHC